MEDKIKQIFDNLNEEETDNLIKDSYEFEPQLNEDRIKNMVLERTGLKKSISKVKKRIIFIAASAAACILIIIGVYALMPESPFGGRFNKDGMVAQKDKDDNSDDQDKSNDNENDTDTFAAATETPVQSGGEEAPFASDSGKKNDKKEGRDKKKPDTGGKVELGDYGKLKALSSNEIEKLFDSYANEIDMDAFEAEYDTLEAMINDSDYIVRGKKTASSLEILDEEYMYSLIAEFKVTTVLSDKTGKDIPEKIKVNESILVDEKRECYTYVGGYNYMRAGKEYILFLKKAEKGHYDIAGRVYGKVPLNPNEEILYIDSGYNQEDDIKNLYKIIDFGREKYIEQSNNATASPKPSPQAIITPSPAPEKTAVPPEAQTSEQ